MPAGTKERWKPIEGFLDYEVSDAGRIRSLKIVAKSRIMKCIQNANGYLKVNLCRDGKRYQRAVHRLVLEAFHGPCPDGLQCCHGDGDRANNCSKNLRWDTPEENFLDSVRHGTAFVGKGIDHALARLSEDDVRYIRKSYAGGSMKQTDLAQRFGVSQKHISEIVNHKMWRHLD
jgi:Mn-dependent DtxR family transcriptional regulator